MSAAQNACSRKKTALCYAQITDCPLRRYRLRPRHSIP
nr:MAG TPA: hypothetical protein [Caudoviricetes sp.]